MRKDLYIGLSGKCFRLACALAIMLAAAFSSDAQSTGGRVRGTVTDASGGAITGARLLLTNEANGTQRDTGSGANGEYIFLEVPVGTYQIEVSQQGFKKYFRKGLLVNLNEVVSLDIALQIGGATEVVEVTGAPALVDTTSTQLGAVVNERAVSQLPLAQRYKALRNLITGVIDYRVRHDDAARPGKFLQARGDIDAVAKDVLTIDDDVADVDADA